MKYSRSVLRLARRRQEFDKLKKGVEKYTRPGSLKKK